MENEMVNQTGLSSVDQTCASQFGWESQVLESKRSAQRPYKTKISKTSENCFMVSHLESLSVCHSDLSRIVSSSKF